MVQRLQWIASFALLAQRCQGAPYMFRLPQLFLRHALLLLTLLGPAQALAAGPGCSRPIKVAFSSIGREMMVSPNGSLSGIAYNFLTEVAERTGCRFDFQSMPRARAWVLMEQGEVDLIPAAVPTARRDHFGIFLDHLLNQDIALLSLKKSGLTIHNLDELIHSHIRVDVVRGYDYGPEYKALLANPALRPRVSETVDPDNIARKLLAGRTDAFLMPPSVFIEAAIKEGIEEQIVAQPLALPAPRDGMYLVTSHLSKQDATTLLDSIKALNNEGEYIRFFRQAHQDMPAWVLKGVRNLTGK